MQTSHLTLCAGGGASEWGNFQSGRGGVAMHVGRHVENPARLVMIDSPHVIASVVVMVMFVVMTTGMHVSCVVCVCRVVACPSYVCLSVCRCCR